MINVKCEEIATFASYFSHSRLLFFKGNIENATTP